MQQASPADRHLDDDDASAFAEGRLEAERATAVLAHLDGCAECRRLVSRLAALQTGAPHDATPSSDDDASGAEHPQAGPGQTIGRYRLVEKVGAGGMGVVWAAFDPELDRNVAIKLLRPDVSLPVEPNASARLRREAQAMAKLSHPNVVAVHDVGTWHDQVFMVMELVEGVTLCDWLAQEPRSWQAALDVCLRAGRGLAAAHDAGLVHRDFKPTNVLCGHDGRVLVADFGLAGHHTVAPRSRPETAGDVDVAANPSLSGLVAGTPRYMAPEQLAGGRADPRSDQFSYAATVYEAIFGEPAPAKTTWSELADDLRSGRLAPPTHVRGVPVRIRRALLRGISVDPNARYDSVTALCNALSVPRTSRRRGVAVALVLATATAITALVAGTRQDPRDEVRAAARADAARVWNAPRRATIAVGFAATRRPYAADTAARVTRIVDELVGDWIEMRVDAWSATSLRGEQSSSILDLRVGCLARRLSELDRLLSVFTGPVTDKLVESAVAATLGLTPVSSCAEVENLAARMRMPDSLVRRAQVEKLLSQLDDVAARHASGQYERARAQLVALQPEIDAVAFAPTTARAHWLLGVVSDELGDPKAAEASLLAAAEHAADAGDSELEARAWLRLSTISGVTLSVAERGAAWYRVAATAVARAAPSDDLQAQLHEVDARLQLHRGDHTAAKRAVDQALQIRRTQPASTELARVLTLASIVGNASGAVADAQTFSLEALEQLSSLLGPQHPTVAKAHNNHANALAEAGKYEEARVHYDKAHELLRAVFGDDHPAVMQTKSNLATIARYRGDFAVALSLYREVLAYRRRIHPAGHPSIADLEYNLGVLLGRMRQFGQAREHLARALASRSSGLGEQHPDTAAAHTMLGAVLLEEGDPAGAIAEHHAALRGVESQLGPNHPVVVDALAGLGKAELAAGRPRAALATLQRALAALQEGDDAPFFLADVQFSMAQTLAALGPVGTRAIALAREAERNYERSGEDAAQELPGVRAWLARYSPTRGAGAPAPSQKPAP